MSKMVYLYKFIILICIILLFSYLTYAFGLQKNYIYAQGQICNTTEIHQASVLCRCQRNQCRLSAMPAYAEGKYAMTLVGEKVLGGVVFPGINAFMTWINLDTAIQVDVRRAQQTVLAYIFNLDVPRYACFNPGTTLPRLSNVTNVASLKNQNVQSANGPVDVSTFAIAYGKTNTSVAADTEFEYALVRDLSYRDDFSPSSGNIVPAGATCKLTSDGKVAYWSSNVYEAVYSNTPINISNTTCSNPLFSSYDLNGIRVDGTSTFFGCLPNSINGIVSFIVRFIVGLSIFVLLMIILINIIFVLQNPTNPEVVGASQKRIINSVISLGFIIFAMFFLRLFNIIIIDLILFNF